MIQPLAYIHPSARISRGVTVDPFAVIHGDVEIGEGTWIGSNVTIMDGARIGKNCRIFPGAVISAIPQDLKFEGERSTVEIGDNVTVRECATINRGTVDRMTTKVGSNTLIMAYVHLAHDCIVGSNCIIANAVNMAGHVSVGDYVVIGGMSAVHQFVHIGSHAMVSGGSLVRKDVPPYVKAGREPLSYVGINSVGLRRRGYSNEKITEIQNIYRWLYVSGLNTSEALTRIEAEMPATPERDEIIEFIQNAKRGIMRGYSSEES
ncbi:MAG: acyl-ACP--UDP-N-acetylglucosamine O-acyltransferase [Bacteroidia bacterium]